MARDLLIGNGSLVIGFDTAYRLADLYFPHVGLENHAVRGYLDRLRFLRRNSAENSSRMQAKNAVANSVDKPSSFS